MTPDNFQKHHMLREILQTHRIARLSLLALTVVYVALRITSGLWHHEHFRCAEDCSTTYAPESSASSHACSCCSKSADNPVGTESRGEPHDSNDCFLCQWLDEFCAEIPFVRLPDCVEVVELLSRLGEPNPPGMPSKGRARAPPRKFA